MLNALVENTLSCCKLILVKIGCCDSAIAMCTCILYTHTNVLLHCRLFVSPIRIPRGMSITIVGWWLKNTWRARLQTGKGGTTRSFKNCIATFRNFLKIIKNSGKEAQAPLCPTHQPHMSVTIYASCVRILRKCSCLGSLFLRKTNSMESTGSAVWARVGSNTGFQTQLNYEPDVTP